jgi:demethylmenaquinone methyltransferase/2-methoxy-6-polyprenyl-1,4-benzoquinol methylase
MLKLAKKDKRKTGSTSFQLADACYLPFRNDSFDCAFISLALHEKERDTRDKVISEMKRVVRQGGALIFIDFQLPLAKNMLSRLAKAIEFFAGRNHHRCFKDYIEQGGLGEILKKNQLNEDKRGYYYDRLITIIRAINS